MSGVDFLIYVDKSANETPQYIKVGGQRGGKLNRSADTVDTTTKDDKGWKNNRPGLLEWSLEGDGILIDTDEGYKKLEANFYSRTPVKVKMATTGGNTYEGLAIITDFPIDAPYDGEATYSLKLQGAGALKNGTSSEQ